ncbi:phage portal protein [Endozoicomonas sp. ISHI1]|nr:phage portal protein [Endozoicomonas sp. ISHI1]
MSYFSYFSYFSFLEKLVANIVGTGIKPKSEARDDGFRKELQALFLDCGL